MGRTTQSRSPTESPTRKGADSATKEKERIEAIKEAGKAARAPDNLIRHFIGSNTTVDDAKKGFKELEEKGEVTVHNLAVFHQVKVKEAPKT